MRVGISILLIALTSSCVDFRKNSVAKEDGFITYVAPTTDTVDVVNNKYTFKWEKASRISKPKEIITYEFRSAFQSHPDSLLKNKVIISDTAYTKEFIFNNVMFYWQVIEVNNTSQLKIYGKIDSVFLLPKPAK